MPTSQSANLKIRNQKGVPVVFKVNVVEVPVPIWTDRSTSLPHPNTNISVRLHHPIKWGPCSGAPCKNFSPCYHLFLPLARQAPTALKENFAPVGAPTLAGAFHR